MKMPEYKGDGWVLHNSDCIEGMASMPQDSVDCVVTSIPFGSLFVYSDSERDLGNAGDGEDFVAQYKFFCDGLYRVMKPGRTACIHVTDLPMRKGRDGEIGLRDFSGDVIRAHIASGMIYHGRATIFKDPVVEMTRTKAIGLLYKQLCKDSAMSRVGMPDYVLFFRKPGENPDAIEHANENHGEDPLPIARKWLENLRREGLVQHIPDDKLLSELLTHSKFTVREWQKLASPVWMDIQQGKVLRSAKADMDERHLCVLQLDVIEKCLRLYSKPGDVVMDPFNGVGSTGTIAIKNLRRYVGFELKSEYARQANGYLTAAERESGDLFSIQ